MYLSSPMPRRLGAVMRIMANGNDTVAQSQMIRVPVLPAGGGSVSPIVRGPIMVYNPLGPDVNPPLPVAASANAGTPVPAGYSTSQIFVAPDGSFWEYSASQSRWLNVGTPYNTGAGGVPPVTPGTTPSAPTSLATPTVAPAPVNVSVAAPSSSYQSILDWLQQDTLGATVGFSSIPNWIVAAAAGALAWKFSQPASRSRNPLRKRRRR